MLGLAQRLFLERSKNRKEFAGNSSKLSWPLLDRLLELNCLAYVDLALARHLLSKFSCEEESCAALICHLSMSARQGHLCVTIKENRITPSPEAVWLSPGKESLDAEEVRLTMEALNKAIIEGARNLPHPLICHLDNFIDSVSTPLCKKKSNFYLQRYWHLESYFVNGMRDLLSESSCSKVVPDLNQVHRLTKELLDKGDLLPEQASAIIHGCTNQFTIITGGPGTGKTFTAGTLLQVFWNSLQSDLRKDFHIELVAPTGKAAANLEESIRRALKDTKNFPFLSAKTLHALMGIRKSRFTHKTIIQADLVLVDESSMIDAQIMGLLLSSLKPGSRLIMLGDRFQLPPVEAGSLFSDLVCYLLQSPKKSCVIELKTCLRAELKGIIDLSEEIKQGRVREALKLLEEESIDQATRFVSLDEGFQARKLQQQLLNYAWPHFPSVSTFLSNPLNLLKAFSKFRLLAPLRKGLLGVESLNNLFYQETLRKGGQAEELAIPIIIVKNDPYLKLFNGEVGIWIRDRKSSREKDFAFFASRESGQPIRKIPFLFLPKFEYAYCLSIHKSQGSEFDHVLMILSQGSENFGREALYTGITRAKRRIEIWANPSVLSKMIAHPSYRNSGVKNLDELD